MAIATLWFDNLARGVAAPSSRRFILGGPLGGWLLPGASPAQVQRQGGGT
jgi:hypothetical protein